MSEETPKRAFKGVWIPAWLWEHPDLSWTEKLLLAEIASYEQCFAGNAYLGEKLGVSPKTIAHALGRLRSIGLILSWDDHQTHRRQITVCRESDSNPGGEHGRGMASRNREPLPKIGGGIPDFGNRLYKGTDTTIETAFKPVSLEQQEHPAEARQDNPRKPDSTPSKPLSGAKPQPPDSAAPPSPKKNRGTEQDFADYAVSIGLPASDGRARFHGLEANGWLVGKNPVKDWRALMRAWKEAGHHPSQKLYGGIAPKPVNKRIPTTDELEARQ